MSESLSFCKVFFATTSIGVKNLLMIAYKFATLGVRLSQLESETSELIKRSQNSPYFITDN